MQNTFFWAALREEKQFKSEILFFFMMEDKLDPSNLTVLSFHLYVLSDLA